MERLPRDRQRLLEGGADPTLRNKSGNTALDFAHSQGKSDIVALLSEPRYTPRGTQSDRCMIATRFPCGGGERRLGRTRTAVFRPLAKRMAASCHGMRPRGRSARPLGRNGASRLHAHKIWRAGECSAPWWAHRESAARAAWVATLVADEIGRAGRATNSGTPTRAQARTWTLALRRAHSGARTQAAITSNHEQSAALRSTRSPHAVAPRRRPRRGRCCLFCH